MKFLTHLATATALATFALVQAQDPAAYAAGLVTALESAGLTSLLGIASTNADVVIPLLMSGNHTVFAPSNEALAAVDEATRNNRTLLLNLVSYHVYNGTLAVEDLSASNHTIANSSLTDPAFVNLPGGRAQVAVLVANEGQVTIVEALENVTTTGSTTFENLRIYTIPSVPTIPDTITATSRAAGLTALVDAATANAPELVVALDESTGLTVFAPINSAFEKAASVVSGLSPEQIKTVLANHFVNGTVVYSSSITGESTATTASGQPLTFITNSTGIFVQSADIVAQVVRSDVTVKNGVVHLIDNVLTNTASDPAAASSAVASASSAAETGVTVTATPTQVLAPSPSAVEENSAAGGSTFGISAVGVLALAAALAV